MELNFKYEAGGVIKDLTVQVKETGLTFNYSQLTSWGTVVEPTSCHWEELEGVKYYTQIKRSGANSVYPYTKFAFLPSAINSALASLVDWTDTTYQMILQSGMDNFVGDDFQYDSYKTVHCGKGSVLINFGLTTLHEGGIDIPAYVNSGIVHLNPNKYPSEGEMISGLIVPNASTSYGALDDTYTRRPNLMFLHVTIHDDDATSETYDEDFDVIVILRSMYDAVPPTCYSEICFIDKRLFGEGQPDIKPSKSTAKGNTPNGFRGGRDDYSDTDTISEISTAISHYANSALHGVHFYHLPAYTDYNEFCEAMWSDDTWAQFDSRGEWNPVGGVLTLALMPCYPDRYNNIVTGNIRSSGKELLLDDDPVTAITPSESTAQLTSRAIKPLEYSHSFLDWTGFTKAFIRLPFIGIQQIDISKIMNGGIIVKYNIDFVTGNCLAQVYTIPEQSVMGDRSNDYPYQAYDDTVADGCCVMIGQYAGNCAHKIPYSGASIGGVNTIGSIVSGVVGAAAVVGGAYIERPSMIVGGIGAIGTAISNLAVPNTHPMTQNATPNADTMGMLVPALIIERPIDLTPVDENGVASVYEHFNGRPSAGGGQVKDYKAFDTGEGIFIKGVIHADTLYATEDEKRQIEEAFARGVYL